ncbi:HlyD family efflux transporter periplasmic adaptor subunit [Amylibacter sp. SFDW26]|uniref:HlyD family secretion protein n=1 Tax=Amylibacter sp. SFDW26 TaxID=2652722 RepID=UPI0012627558|nr:HlyD family efflux transporter periplasmic adaptor subunit [Amylibacter sp. SFDW26]KAB7610149.1 HlyD family efflux transporter periplasmic adaptor subunit [Amylibacter sp. SFDW26]
MNIRHECPMPDLSFRVTAPLYLHAPDGQTHTIDRWSLTGFILDGFEGDLPEGLYLSVPFQGIDIKFPIDVIPLDEEGGFSFTNLTVRQRETLSMFYKGILTGRMVSTSEMITSLDTPVDLVPMGETEREMASGMAKTRPRILRIIWNVVFYISLAVFLFGFVGNQIWKRLSVLELDHGRFVAPIITYQAPESAYIQKILVKEGDNVSAGDILVRLEDPDREGQVEEVRTEIRIAERRLNQAQVQLDKHIARLDEFRQPYWDAFYYLWYPWDQSEHLYDDYPQDVQKAWDIVKRFDEGQMLQPGSYHDIRQALQRRVDEYYLDLRRWKRDLSNKKAAADELHVIARTDGIVSSVPVLQGSFASRSETVVEVEENTPRVAIGWLDDRMVSSVYIGMPATVSYSFRGQSKSITGTIIDLQAGSDEVQPDKFGMVITIKADDSGLKKTRKWFRHNAPAGIRLHRKLFFDFTGSGDNEST